MRASLAGSRALGFILGLVGASLDFYSGYLILGGPDFGTAMALTSSAPFAWGVGILVLGIAVILTAALLALSSRVTMRIAGDLMGVYGIAMLIIGASMYWGIAPMMQGAGISGLGMIAVGLLMLANGYTMKGSMMAAPSMSTSPMTSHTARNAALVVAVVLVVTGAVVLSEPSVLFGAGASLELTTTSHASNASQIMAGSANCSGSGSTEVCNLELTNAGNSAATVSGTGTLVYGGAGAMGANTVSTSNGCRVVSGSLDPGQSAQVSCSFTVMTLAASGSQLSGTVGLTEGDSASFLGTVS